MHTHPLCHVCMRLQKSIIVLSGLMLVPSEQLFFCQEAGYRDLGKTTKMFVYKKPSNKPWIASPLPSSCSSPPTPQPPSKLWSSTQSSSNGVLGRFPVLIFFFFFFSLFKQGVSTDGKASTVISAFHTQDVSMALALNHGNASVKPTGVVSSATKVR